MEKYKDLSILKSAKSICLIGHIDPDTDAFASMVVFKDFIKDTFKVKSVDIFAETENITSYYKPIIDDNKINCGKSKYDIAIMMDCPNTERLGKYKTLFTQSKIKIVIDHHATNLFEGDINIVEPCSATCEIVYQILKEFDYKLNKKQFGKIYSGIVTDTGNFSVGTITKETFKICSEILPNINYNKIINHFCNTVSLKNQKLYAIAIKNLKTFNNDKILITHVSNKDMKKLKTSFEDFFGISNRLNSINNSCLVCFIYPKENEFYVSLRAKQGYDVSAIAKKYGGGGHIGAAAYMSKDKIKKIEKQILNEFYKEISKNINIITTNPFEN